MSRFRHGALSEKLTNGFCQDRIGGIKFGWIVQKTALVIPTNAVRYLLTWSLDSQWRQSYYNLHEKALDKAQKEIAGGFSLNFGKG